MEMESQPGARLAFGPFEVDQSAGEIRKSGIRIRLAPQPFEILLLLLAHPGGVVTREQLHEKIWSDGTFVDFERGLNSAMAKLRRALGDDAERPRYIETHPGRGYRFIGSLQGRDLHLQSPLPAGTQSASDPASHGANVIENKRSSKRWWWLAGIVTCAVLFAVGVRIRDNWASPSPWKVSQLTADAGFSETSAMSPDGKLVAFSSDRGHAGERDIYVKLASGGEPIRLTSDGAGNTTPDFSPDGSRMVFRSDRDGGGIYEIPTLGGETRLLAMHGLNPRISPDGSEVAYWVGDPNIAAAVPGGGEVWVVPIGGGEPRRIGATFTNARYPIWSPDSRHLLLVGYTAGKPADHTAIDWWLVATSGGYAARTGIHEALPRGGLQLDMPSSIGTTFPNVPNPGCWLASTNSVIFSARTGDTWNLWETGISPRTGTVNGTFKRLTAGAGNEKEPSCASANALTFTNVEAMSDVWSQTYDLNRGKSTGGLERITTGPSDREPSLSGNGRFVTFASARSGPLNIWTRNLETGEEAHVASSPDAHRFPLINSTGSKIAYSAFESGHRSLYMWTSGGVPAKICEGCLRATDWSADEKTLLIFGGAPYEIDLLDLATRQRIAILKHPTYNLLNGRFSPDARWISFTARTQPDRALIVIAPLNGQKPVPASAWITIAEAAPEDRANWSPDGKTLYYSSARDGRTCIWGQRVDPGTRQPVGKAFAVQHFHGRASFAQGGWSAEGGRVTEALAGGTTNIWMMSRSPAH